MTQDQAAAVRAIDELWTAKTPATVRSVALALPVDDAKAKELLTQLIDRGAAIMTPIKITVLDPNETSAIADAYWLMVPDAIFDASVVLGSWK